MPGQSSVISSGGFFTYVSYTSNAAFHSNPSIWISESLSRTTFGHRMLGLYIDMTKRATHMSTRFRLNDRGRLLFISSFISEALPGTVVASFKLSVLPVAE